MRTSLIDQRVCDDLDLVKEFLDYSDKCAKAGRMYEAGAGAAGARDGCEAIATRLECLATALDRGEYHNERLQWFRRLALRCRNLQVALAVRVAQIEKQLAA